MYTAKNKNTKPGNNPNAYQVVNEQIMVNLYNVILLGNKK